LGANKKIPILLIRKTCSTIPSMDLDAPIPESLAHIVPSLVWWPDGQAFHRSHAWAFLTARWSWPRTNTWLKFMAFIQATICAPR
jgi:hypothetical protein